MSTVFERIAAKRAELEELERLARDEADKELIVQDSVQADEREEEEQEETAQKKHQRGGRRIRRRGNFGLADSKKPWSQRNGRLITPYEDHADSDGQISGGCINLHEDANSEFTTGIDKFNVRRPEAAAEGEPIEISLEPKESLEAQSMEDSNFKQKARNKNQGFCDICGHRAELKECRKGSNCDNKTAADAEKHTQHEKSQASQESTKAKPVAIRLDLNLELEILLRAKVKGDITITFL